jgi:16S rRNA (cytidine1402-2'-O)-methyltransferase
MRRFLFQGFLPAKTTRRRQQLAELAMETPTLVFFESPNRLLSALHDVFDIMGNRDVVVCRELTKIYESFYRGTVHEAIRALEGRRIKGEITLLVSGYQEAKPDWSETALLQRFEQLRQNPALSRRDCVDRVAAETGVPKSRVYRLTVTE